jgi:lipoyl(octanoyl) transferase
MRPLNILSFPVLSYPEAQTLQMGLIPDIKNKTCSSTVIFLEHSPCITIGRKKNAELNILNPNDIPVYETQRGGDVTWHGPGQLVCYFLHLFDEDDRDLHRYLRNLEEVVIHTMNDFGFRGERRSGLTGVWCEEKKICSMGIAVKSWVSYHGLAINLHADIDGFKRLNPCGLDANVMTNLYSESLPQAVNLRAQWEERLSHHIEKIFLNA